ncbi:Glycosyltransferase [Lactobacillus casei W56] [Lacticaseibacillus rhamnosus]|nr:Glycosyltransferase [Lactobacillus casei W56] [Lacticaseibacillus rhamnosus]
MIQNAEFNYPGYKGTCLPMGELESHRSDIWVATLWESVYAVSYTHLQAHETEADLVCRLLLEKKKKTK